MLQCSKSNNLTSVQATMTIGNIVRGIRITLNNDNDTNALEASRTFRSSLYKYTAKVVAETWPQR